MSRGVLLSSIVPAYNAERFIAATIGSLAEQSIGVDRQEVVVVDDGSHDATAEIAATALSKAGFARWEVLQQANAGPGAARNRGLKWSRSDWVRFLDADDLIAPSLSEWQIDVAGGANDALAVIYCNWCHLINDKIERIVMPVIGHDPISDILKIGNFIATGSQIYCRRWVLSVGGWDEGIWHAEDHKLLMTIALQGGQFLKISQSEPQFFYRAVSGSLSRTPGVSVIRDRLAYAAYVEAELIRTNQASHSSWHQLNNLQSLIARDLMLHDPVQATKLLKHVLTRCPKFAPDWSAKVRRLSRLIGLANAAYVSAIWQSYKQNYL